MKIYRAADRGHVNHGWLEAKHSFSFGEYYNPQAMSYGSLRVLNEDIIEPSKGFGMHGHQDAEILTYVLSGTLQHEDSMGHGGTIQHGEVQYMRAGSGVRHSEFNASDIEPVHLYQIWILPKEKGLEPHYEQKDFSVERSLNQWQVIASPSGEDKSFCIAQDLLFYTASLERGCQLNYQLEEGRRAWLQLARGELKVNGEELRVGDAISFGQSSLIIIEAKESSEILLFDLE